MRLWSVHIFPFKQCHNPHDNNMDPVAMTISNLDSQKNRNHVLCNIDVSLPLSVASTVHRRRCHRPSRRRNSLHRIDFRLPSNDSEQQKKKFIICGWRVIGNRVRVYLEEVVPELKPIQSSIIHIFFQKKIVLESWPFKWSEQRPMRIQKWSQYIAYTSLHCLVDPGEGSIT